MLEDRITSIRFGTQIMLSFSLAYSIKLTAFLFGLFSTVIPIWWLRLAASFLFSLPFAFGLLKIAMFGSRKYLKYIVSLFDFILFLYILDIENHSNPVKVLFFSMFGSFVYFQLIDIFIVRRNQKVSNSERKLRELNNELAISEQTLADLEGKIVEINKRTCPKCENIFSSKNAVNAHIRSCKGKQIS